MKKILLIILSVFIVAMMLSTSVVFAEGNELIVEFKDAGINVPNSGGSPYIEEDGWLQTFVMKLILARDL